MSYLRVIPRDLFNEANLLKCYGQLYLNLEKMGLQECLRHSDDDGEFQISHDIDGNTWLGNVTLEVAGEVIWLHRGLNARGAYPLWARDPRSGDEVEVFNDNGSFTSEMKQLLAPITIDEDIGGRN